MSSISASLYNLIYNLKKYGYSKEANNIIAYISDNKNKLYKGQPGSVAPILQLSNIINKIKKSNLFKYLPEHIIKGLIKIDNLTDNAFKFASKNASLFKQPSPVEKLNNLLSNIENKINFIDIPEEIIAAFNKLKASIQTHLKSYTDTTDTKKTKEDLTVDKNLAKFEEKLKSSENQKHALKTLANNLLKSKTYKEIFYKLPTTIINELKKINLDPDSLLSIATAKSANYIKQSSISNTILMYLNKKYAVDFSTISNLLSTNKYLNNREISRAIRLAIASELDAIHLYELIADSSDNKDVKKVLQDIANEEKIHVGELQQLLSSFDIENNSFMEKGINETNELILNHT